MDERQGRLFHHDLIVWFLTCSILDGLLPILTFIISCVLLLIRQETFATNDFLRLPTAKTVSIFRRSIILLIVTLLEISSWAFVFAWRLESAILERSRDTRPPLYQIVDPSLAFIPRVSCNSFIVEMVSSPECLL